MKTTGDKDYAAQAGDMIFFHRDDGTLSFDSVSGNTAGWIAAESAMLHVTLRQLFGSRDIHDVAKGEIVRRIAVGMAVSHGLSDARLVGIGRHVFSIVLV